MGRNSLFQKIMKLSVQGGGGSENKQRSIRPAIYLREFYRASVCSFIKLEQEQLSGRFMVKTQ